MASTKVVFTKGDATRGAQLYNKIYEHYHNIEPSQLHKFGPTLAGMYGTQAGRISDAMTSPAKTEQRGGESKVWDEQTPAEYSADCKKSLADAKTDKDRNIVLMFSVFLFPTP